MSVLPTDTYTNALSHTHKLLIFDWQIYRAIWSRQTNYRGQVPEEGSLVSLLYEMLSIQVLKPSLNVQSDSTKSVIIMDTGKPPNDIQNLTLTFKDLYC